MYDNGYDDDDGQGSSSRSKVIEEVITGKVGNKK